MLNFWVGSLHVVFAPGEAAPQEQVTEIPVPMQEEEIVHVPKIITQTRQVQQTLSSGIRNFQICLQPLAHFEDKTFVTDNFHLFEVHKLKEKYSSEQNQRKISSILAKSSDPRALEALRTEVEVGLPWLQGWDRKSRILLYRCDGIG